MDFTLIVPAFIAGLLTFLAPCTLPIVPGYLGFISGVSLKDLQDHEKAKGLRLKIFFNGLLFVLGFSSIFIILGVVAGAAGGLLGEYRIWISRFGGIFIILFGIFLLGWLKIPFLQKEKQFHPKIFKKGNYLTSFILGGSFGFGWTPCVGPILGSILLLASTSATAGQGALLLSVFSLGLGIPFLIIAIGIGSAGKYLNKISKYLDLITKIGGVFLILLGILIFTDNMSLLISHGYRLLEVFNYDRLLDYL